MKIDILYFTGCPNADATRALVERVLREQRIAAQVDMVEVDDVGQVGPLRFLGSPTVQVDGIDIEPARRKDRAYAMTCRIYQTPDGPSGVPPEGMVEAALTGCG